jgi:hypothetical protein
MPWSAGVLWSAASIAALVVFLPNAKKATKAAMLAALQRAGDLTLQRKASQGK